MKTQLFLQNVLLENCMKGTRKSLYINDSSRYKYYQNKINDILYDEQKHLVSQFKDYLLWDESSDFLRRYSYILFRFYNYDESSSRIPKISEFFEKYSVIMPNYFVLEVRRHILKNLNKKIKLIEKRDCSEEVSKETNDKYSTFLKNSVVKRINENSLSFSINDSNFYGNVRELINDETISNKYKSLNSSFSQMTKIVDLTTKKESQKQEKINKNIYSNKEIKLKYSSQFCEQSTKPSLLPLNRIQKNSVKQIKNNIFFNNNKTKPSLKFTKEKSITPLIRISKIALNTPTNYKQNGFLTSRNENTPSTLLSKNRAKEKIINQLTKIDNLKSNSKKNLDKNKNILIKRTYSIKKMISNIVISNNLIKKPSSKNNVIVKKEININERKVGKPSFYKKDIKSPSIYNINLDLNLNLNLNLNTNYKSFYKKPSESIITINYNNNCGKNQKETSLFKLKSLYSKRSENEMKIPLTERILSNRPYIKKKLSSCSQPGGQYFEEKLKRYGSNDQEKTLCKLYDFPKKPINEINRKQSKNTKPINLKIDLNRLCLKDSKPLNNTKKNFSKENIKENKNVIKGIKINNFEKIYKIKEVPIRPPNSTNRDSNDKVKNHFIIS